MNLNFMFTITHSGGEHDKVQKIWFSVPRTSLLKTQTSSALDENSSELATIFMHRLS
jgi:hypothetical protein